MLTSVLIGSHPNMPSTTLTVRANGVTEALAIAGGAYYVDHYISSFNLCYVIEQALESHSEISSADVYLGNDGRVHANADVAFGADWASGAEARLMTGLTQWTDETIGASTTHQASSDSSYIWIPRRTESSEARLGTLGTPYHDTQVGMDAEGGNMVAVSHRSYRKNSFEWNHVLNHPGAAELVWDEDESPGTYYAFWESVLRKLHRFNLYRLNEFDESDDTDMGPAFALRLGPYQMMTGRGRMEFPYDRSEQNVESYANVELDVALVSEYT